MNKYFILIFSILISIQSFAQESLEPLGINPTLVRKFKQNNTSVNRSVNETYIYSMDTIRLPFKDDFSSDKFKKYNAKPTDANVSDTLFYAIWNAGSPDVDTAKFMLDTTYNFRYTPTAVPDSFQIDTIPLASMGMRTICDLDAYPITCVTVPVWPPYNTEDTVGTPASPDKIYDITPPDAIQDSARVYFVAATDTNSIWQDNYAYLNNSFGINPPTIGVVTFDGLNENGYPYNFSSPISEGIADYLTSKPISLNLNLSGAPSNISDSLYLSFYYQAKGLGDEPEPGDSLMLEFWSPNDNSWFFVWSSGDLNPDTLFEHAMIPILDAKYLKDGFKFRFSNYGALSGNFDNWNIDYVYLNSFRSYDDTVRDDAAFQKPIHTLLNEYTEMPWNHFKKDPSSYMLDSVIARQRNNSNTGKLIGNNVLEIRNGAVLQQTVINPGTPSINAFTNFTTKFDLPSGYFFDTTGIDTNATFDISVRHSTTPDFTRLNDTFNLAQNFWDYYSYDDGTAEAAYGVQGLGGLNPEIAMQYNLKEGDSIKSVFMHFSPSAYNMSSTTFYITIWNENNGKPGTILFENSGTDVPRYNIGMNGFYEYPLDSNVYLPAGNYYIGIVQTTIDRINFGFDRNIDKSSKVFYNSNGTWRSSGFEGNIMVRPSFVFQRDYLIGQEEIEIEKISVYPNPTNSVINFSSSLKLYQYELQIMDLSGKIIFEGKPTNNFDVSGYQTGIYLLKLINNDNGTIKVSKFVKSNN